ncbi:hypothetical protein C8J56DRAFT_1048761 [Mycena floridula]|nr:hypothetical protein C8J56DRAFT_1048761 [Mycena floridula]
MSALSQTIHERCKRIGDYYKLAETECREEEIIAQACLQEQSPILRQKLEVQLQEELAKQRDVKFDLTMELVTQVLNLGESAEDEAKFQSLCLQLQALSARRVVSAISLSLFMEIQFLQAAMQMQKITLVSDDVIRGALGKLTGNSATDWEQDAGKRAKVIKRAFFIYSLRPLDDHGESLLALDIIKARRPIHEAFKIKAAELRARMVRERAELEENLVQDHLRLLSIQQGLQSNSSLAASLAETMFADRIEPAEIQKLSPDDGHDDQTLQKFVTGDGINPADFQKMSLDDDPTPIEEFRPCSHCIQKPSGKVGASSRFTGTWLTEIEVAIIQDSCQFLQHMIGKLDETDRSEETMVDELMGKIIEALGKMSLMDPRIDDAIGAIRASMGTPPPPDLFDWQAEINKLPPVYKGPNARHLGIDAQSDGRTAYIQAQIQAMEVQLQRANQPLLTVDAREKLEDDILAQMEADIEVAIQRWDQRQTDIQQRKDYAKNAVREMAKRIVALVQTWETETTLDSEPACFSLWLGRLEKQDRADIRWPAQIHALAHQPPCLARNQRGNQRMRIGLTDGEGVKNIWSTLQVLVTAVGYISPEYRPSLLPLLMSIYYESMRPPMILYDFGADFSPPLTITTPSDENGEPVDLPALVPWASPF